MTRKWLALLVIVSMLIFVTAGCAPKAAPPAPSPAPAPAPPVEKIVWKESQYTTPDNPTSILIKMFTDEVEKRSGGRIEFKHFLSGGLAGIKEQPDGLKSGLMDITSFYAAIYPSKIPLNTLALLPCVIPLIGDSREVMLTFMDIVSEWSETPPLMEEYAKWGGMYLYPTYPLCFSIMEKRVPVKNLEDLKELKVYASGGCAKALGKAGIVTIMFTMPEMYDALSKGTVEAAVSNISCHYGYRFYEVCDYWTRGVNLSRSTFAQAMRIEAYEALPEDLKAIFQEVKKETPQMVADVFEDRIRESVEAFEKKGIEVVEFSAADNEKLRDLSNDIWKEDVDKLEEQGLPAREAFNSLQDIIKKHIPGYEPYHL